MTQPLRVIPSLKKKMGWLTDKRNRAFVAAPLLGTIIFLACVIFIINLNKIESANVVLSESDSYHNRIVSLLEMYRSDTSSMFRQQLTYVIEHYLTSGCWLNLFDVDNGKKPAEPVENPEYDDGKIVRFSPASHDEDYKIEELRYSKCKSVNRILSQVSQSVYSCKGKCTPTTAVPKGDCTCGGQTPCASFKDCSEKDQGCIDCENALYGLPKIMNDLSADTTFEGVTFHASNAKEFEFFKTDPGGPEAEQFSSTLLAGSLFDCGAFARDGSFSCCSVSGDFFDENQPSIGVAGSTGYRPAGANYDERYLYDWNTPCEQRVGVINKDEKNPVHGQVVTGCEDGSFFMRVSLNNNFVYQRMPRFMADDSVGNQLRTGALGESDFFLPVSYPLYQYINYSFELFERLAYGNKRGGESEADAEGIADGLCVQSKATNEVMTPGECGLLDKYKDGGFTGSKCAPGNDQACVDDVRSAFIEKLLKDSCTDFSANHPQQASVYLCVEDDSKQSASPCSEGYDSWHYTCSDSAENGLYSKFDDIQRLQQVQESQGEDDVLKGACPSSDFGQANGQPYCSAFDRIVLSVRFNDLTYEHRVDPDKQNTFCSYIHVKHRVPTTTP